MSNGEAVQASMQNRMNLPNVRLCGLLSCGTPRIACTVFVAKTKCYLVIALKVAGGKATGGTFSKKGKTDIYLNIDKGNVLTFECKIWGGQVLYGKTITQLLGYLTWRQTFGIMITFVRQKNFSKVLADAPQAITEHASYRSGFKPINSTHFMSNHVLPGDDDKQVEIHHLFYNIYA